MAWAAGPVPGTPIVISPSPTVYDGADSDAYFPPTTRSAARKSQRSTTSAPLIDEEEEGASSSSEELKRARTRSRSPLGAGGRRRVSGLTSSKAKGSRGSGQNASEKGPSNGYLSPYSAGFSSWRDFSRSPSPLGLIPIHRHFRYLIHKYEVPRKVFHSSIGFLTLWLMARGFQPSSITPVLFSLLVPIALVDFLRHKYAPLNRIYVKSLGALMRETEVDGYNGVIWYLLGTWTALSFFPKDVGVMSVLLLSWCDTAASTFGRLYGRYTPRLRRGKSLAGSLAAFGVGCITAATYWGLMVPWTIQKRGDSQELYMFHGSLTFPPQAKHFLGLGAPEGKVGGAAALGIVSIFSGLVGALSELVDIFNWDDNLTIPVLSGAGLWLFFRGLSS